MGMVRSRLGRSARTVAAALLAVGTAGSGAVLAATPANADCSFGAGDLVVYRVGNGSGSLANTGNPVFLDEYQTDGTFVQSIPMPTTASGSNQPLVASGTATSEGLLTLSPDGQHLAATGYDSTIPYGSSLVGTASTVVPRTVGLVDTSCNVDTSTALTDWASGNNPRSAVTTDGNAIWVSGAAGGARSTTKGATVSTQLSTTVTNLRQINVFNDATNAPQLFVSDSSGSAVRIGSVGSGNTRCSGFGARSGSSKS